MYEIDESEAIEERRATRRAMMRTLAGTAAVAAGVVLSKSARAQTINDTTIFNFALNLEYLETEYYLRGLNGTGLTPADAGGNPGTVTGGRQVTFQTPRIEALFREIQNNELTHVRFLRSLLGSSAISRPTIDFTAGFNAVAQGAGLGNTFDPFANELHFALGSLLFEEVGVTAYKGTSPLISKANLPSAGGILGTEAYQSGALRALLYTRRATTLPQVGGRTIEQVVQALSNARDTVDSPPDKDQGLVDAGNFNTAPTDANGIAFGRDFSEVLRIVYVGGTSSGGFFPNGVNGPIKTAS